MTVSVFCKIMSVRDRLLARILYSGHNAHRCTELLYVLLQILKLFGDILTFILVFSMVFITPITPAVYSRDHLLSLRSHVIQLNLDQRALIVQLGLSRRGSRAGSHLRRRLQAAASVTSAISRTSQPGEIPTIIGHRVVFINNNQLIDQRCVSIRIAEQREQSSPTFSNTETIAIPSCSSYLPDELLWTSTPTTHLTQQDPRWSLLRSQTQQSTFQPPVCSPLSLFDNTVTLSPPRTNRTVPGKDDRSLTFSISTRCENTHNGLLYTAGLLCNSGQQTTSVVDAGNLLTHLQPSLSPLWAPVQHLPATSSQPHTFQLTCQPVSKQRCQQSGDASLEQQDNSSVLNSHDGTSIDCVSVVDCSIYSTSLLSPISITSLASEPTSLDTPVTLADDTQNVLSH